MSMETEAVARGTAILDEYFGSTGWVEDIDLDNFNMRSNSGCMVGQLFDSFAGGLEELDIVPFSKGAAWYGFSLPMTGPVREEYGYTSADTAHCWYLLEEAWLDVITSRKIDQMIEAFDTEIAVVPA